MSGKRRVATARGPWGRIVRVALTGLAAALALTATPGVASAATGTVTPIVDCYTRNSDGTWTVVFGYVNASGTDVSIPRGRDNKITPVTYGTPQPTTFQPGTHRGVFSVTVARGAGPMWHLDRSNVAARRGTTSECSASVPLPATGNGTGLVVALLIGAVVGVLVVRRRGRRRPGAAGEPVDA